MPGDAFAGLFKRRREIDLPCGTTEANARRLAQKGLIQIEESSYVRCVNPLDRDQHNVYDRSCSGRIYLDSERDEVNGDYQCPDCDRVVYPSMKHRSTSIRVLPVAGAMRHFVREEIVQQRLPLEENPVGLFRVSMASGVVFVCLADFCPDRAVFAESYPYRETLMFVVGNDRDYLRRLPRGVIAFRLAELVLSDAVLSFRRTLRELTRGQVAVPAPFGPTRPAVLRPRMSLTIEDTASSGSRGRGPIISVPPGTRWNEVKLYLVDGETIAVHVPGRRLQRYHHQQLGLSHRRTGKPSKAWELLEQLCEGHGEIPWNGTARQFNAFKERVSSLRPVLQKAFGIQGDPFPMCSRRSGLRAAFQAFPDLPDTVPIDPSDW